MSGIADSSFNFIGRFTALLFTVTGARLAARRMRILPMMTDNFWNEGK
jgi:hypothetical protein